MARGRAVVRGRAGARLLLRLALIVACSKGRSSTAPAATRLRPAAREAALDWSAYADPQTASQRFRVRTHEPSAAFSSRASCIDAGRRRRARGVASGGHGAGAAQGAPARSSLLSLPRRPSLAVSGCAGALAQEEVFIVGRGSPSLVGTVGTWCGALRAPSAGAGFCSGGRSSVSATPRRYRPIRDQRIANFVARGAGSSADAAASRDPQFDLVLRVPKSAGAEMWQRAVGLWPGQHGARHTRAVLCPSLVPSPVAAGSRAVHAGGVLAAGPWPALIDVQHLCSSSEALRHAKLSPARQELLRRAEEERTADAEQVSVHKLD